MKAIFTSLMILMVSLAFAQTPKYTYIDGNNNTYEYVDGQLKYIPATGTTKIVELSKIDSDNINNLFKAAIDAKADRTTTKETGGGTIKHMVVGKEVKIHLKATSTPRATLETALSSKIN